MTRERINAKGRALCFANMRTEVHRAFVAGQVHLHARVKVRVNEVVVQDEGDPIDRTSYLQTPPSAAPCCEIVPKALPFDMVNKTWTKKSISRIDQPVLSRVGLKATVIFADRLMYTGYEYSTRSGCLHWR